MLAGHYAPALALRRLAPSVPMWVLFLAVQAVDFGFMVLVLAGVESGDLDAARAPRFLVTHGVWTHSLAMTLAYALTIAALGRALGRPREGLVLAAAVASHWLGDLLVHAPDLPLAFEQQHALGLGLWRWPVGAWALECGLVVLAGLVWLRPLTGRARRRATGLIVGLCAVQTLSDFAFPLPASDRELAMTALPLYVVLAAFAWWAERPRQ